MVKVHLYAFFYAVQPEVAFHWQDIPPSVQSRYDIIPKRHSAYFVPPPPSLSCNFGWFQLGRILFGGRGVVGGWKRA